MQAGFALLTLDRGAVHGEVAEVGEKLLGAVLRRDELEQLGRVVDEGRPGLALDERRVRQHTEQERNVGLDACVCARVVNNQLHYLPVECARTKRLLKRERLTANTELDERAKHLAPGNLKRRAPDRALDEQRVIVRRDLRAGETRTRVEADAVPARRAVHLDLARVGLEPLRGVFGRDAALDRVPALRDRVLRQSELGKARAGRDLRRRRNTLMVSSWLAVGWGLESVALRSMSIHAPESARQ